MHLFVYAARNKLTRVAHVQQIQKRSSESLKRRNVEFMKRFENRHDFPDLASVEWKTVESFVGYQV